MSNEANSGGARFGSSSAAIVTAVAAGTAAIYFFRSILAPFFMALVISVVIHWIADSLSAALPRARRWIVTVTTGSVVVAAMLVGFGVVSSGAARILPLSNRIAGRLQDIVQALVSDVGSFGSNPPPGPLFDQTNLASLLQTALQQTATGLSTLGLTMVFLAFILPARTRFIAKFVSLARSSEDGDEVRLVIQRIVRNVRRSVLVQVKAAAITAVASAVLMWALGMPDVPFWTIIVFLTSYVPVIGGVIAGVFPSAFALVELPNPYQPIAIFVGIQAIYLLVGSVGVPRMQSVGLNIDPVMGLASVGVWTLLWGIPGALLATPLTALVMILMAEFESTRWVATLLSNDSKALAD